MKLFLCLLAWALAGACLVSSTSAADPVATTIGANFTGSVYGSTVNSLPADTDGAVGPNHFVEFINGSFAVYNKTTGRSIKRTTDIQFWASTGLIISPDAATTDPRMIYDPISQRWFASMVDANSTATDPTLLANNFLLAVSDSSDPSGTWHGFQFQADPDNGLFADFPTLGVDGQGVYVSGDMYQGQDLPIGPALLSIPKADLLTSPPSIARRTWFGVMDYTNRGDVLQPVSCFDGSMTGRVVAASDIGSVSAPLSNLFTYAVLNPGSTGAVLGAATEVQTLSWEVPDNIDYGFPLLTVGQPDGTHVLMANDARFAARAIGANGSIYAVQSTEYNGHVAIRWYRLRASDNVLVESGTLSDPALDYSFPSIAVNSMGVVVIGFNASGDTMTVSSCAMVGQTINSTTTFGGRMLLQAGATSYHGLDEQLAALLDEPVFSRWGDYSATTVDPANESHFWTVQMIPGDAADESVWATQITELITTPAVAPPSLAIQRSGANVLVSWPLSATGYQLLSNTNLLSTDTWAAVSQTPQTNGSLLQVSLPVGNQQFFRLKK